MRNNNYLFTLSKADSPPYGIDFTPSGGQPTGRFTNGRTIADIVGEAVGGKSFAPPYLSPNAAANAFETGINYASGASGILDGTGTLFRLHGLGARKLVVVGIGPLGCIPFIRATNLIPTGECSVKVNNLVNGYNQKLKQELHQMNKDMGPNAIFVYANSFDIFTQIILNYSNYGFENSDGPCCGGYFPPFFCYKGKEANTNSALCGDRTKYVFWDAYHPTEAANLIVADKLLHGDKSYCSPMNIHQLYNYEIR
ncbi:hypothetical protein BUALT_Bualt10G0004200 [Buddleja alternifolia]|uniref:GDSL esterase/lipase n=1 Tax=Buddleja alternifolia TaxID=168488 RepID=A0AAV6X258_9LAMI|nr:hypothetical protein BUALT_Bualt10G0004200 [Buddleja alternifolia]